ncbi:hypothetical protein RFI_30358 [Reticulomyxa filosa]|uniref:CUE domain-containing protein n=1 Tax=Reticulomyxa filosa TaxID=46433 RepID=X6LYN6_RETFI|nr:hypothetical protein RFI_30358 [Reticulomyxa filosa]|eukprot:ETO07033.1 hypothetical protein RFI_30358 [Reticulomyxa filosa]
MQHEAEKNDNAKEIKMLMALFGDVIEESELRKRLEENNGNVALVIENLTSKLTNLDVQYIYKMSKAKELKRNPKKCKKMKKMRKWEKLVQGLTCKDIAVMKNAGSKGNYSYGFTTNIEDLRDRSENATNSNEIANLITELQKFDITVVKPLSLKGNDRLFEKIQADYKGEFTLLSFGGSSMIKRHKLVMKYVTVWSNISNKSNGFNNGFLSQTIEIIQLSLEEIIDGCVQ